MNRTEKIAKMKEALKVSGLDVDLQTILTELNEENKDKKDKNKDLSDKLNSFNTLLENIGVDKVEDVKTTVDDKSKEIKALQDKLNGLVDKFKNQENEALDIKRNADVTKTLSKYGIKTNLDHWQSSLANMSKYGESGELLVGDKTLEVVVKELADNEPKLSNNHVTKKTVDGEEVLYSEEQLNNLTEEEIEANTELVNKSMLALD